MIQYCHYSRATAAAAATGAIFCGRNLDLQKIERERKANEKEKDACSEERKKGKGRAGKSTTELVRLPGTHTLKVN